MGRVCRQRCLIGSLNPCSPPERIGAEPASHLGRDREVLLLWLPDAGASLSGEGEIEAKVADD